MMKRLLTMLLLLCAVPAFAEIYEWVDAGGTTNFSDDLSKVPSKYRKKVKVIGGENTGEPLITESNDSPKVKAQKEGVADKDGLTPAAALEKKKTINYGGKKGSEWRESFGRTRADLRAAEKQLAELRSRMTDTSKMSRGEYLSLQNTLRQVEFRVLELRKNLESLNDLADKAEVPPELRD